MGPEAVRLVGVTGWMAIWWVTETFTGRDGPDSPVAFPLWELQGQKRSLQPMRTDLFFC